MAAFVFAAEPPDGPPLDRPLLEVLADTCAQAFDRALLFAAEARARRAADVAWRRLSDAVVQAPVAVAVVSGTDHLFEVVNALFLEVVGRTGQDVSGRPLPSVFPALSAGADLREVLDRVYHTGAPVSLDEQRIRVDRGKGAEERSFVLTAQPLRDGGGGVSGLMVVAVDVTAQARARRQAEELEAERARRLEFERQLIGIVSHDLRNPLAAVMMSARVLERLGPEPRARAALDRIVASAQRATRMVRDLLDFTQARLGGGLTVRRRACDLHEVVRGVVDEEQQAHPEARLRHEAEGDAAGSWDPDRVAQAVSNLVSNAARHAAPGSEVRVCTRGLDDAVEVEVHNHGAPLAEEDLGRLFEPLQRGRRSRDRGDRSIGLGLFIVRQVARAHKGEVTVRSAEGEGTAFTLRLPRRR